MCMMLNIARMEKESHRKLWKVLLVSRNDVSILTSVNGFGIQMTTIIAIMKERDEVSKALNFVLYTLYMQSCVVKWVEDEKWSLSYEESKPSSSEVTVQ